MSKEESISRRHTKSHDLEIPAGESVLVRIKSETHRHSGPPRDPGLLDELKDELDDLRHWGGRQRRNRGYERRPKQSAAQGKRPC